ncbi:hypothetical protein BDZ89DRAFT_1074963 [Hymenopellis radicata]|nr:hypothetical protein BDZ89DRAFT_1074963 [Hymenopellis radicata]
MDTVVLNPIMCKSVLAGTESSNCGAYPDNMPTLSGIHRLPVELLSEIFIDYVHSHPFDLWDPNDGPRLLETVCSLWRATVISSPRVWSTFVVVSRPAIHTPSAIKVLHTYLSRSAAAPLTFSFYTGSATSDPNPILELLLNHSHRWHDVMLELPLHLYPSLDRIHGRLPLLHAVSLRAKQSTSPHVGEILAFADAPRLEKLALWGTWTTVQRVTLPWHQLTSYADEDGSATCPQILLAMSNLVDLTYRPRKIDVLPCHVQRLENLTRLRILSGYHLSTFLDYVTLPSLQELTLDDMTLRYEIKSVAGILEDLIGRSRCFVQVLNIDNLAYGDTLHLLRLFRCMPELTSLCIRHYASRELSKLFRTLRGSAVLPKLKMLSLHSDLTAAVIDVVDMVESRWEGEGGVERLQSVECPRYPVYDSFTMSRLRALAKQGLDVCFSNRVEYSDTWY